MGRVRACNEVWVRGLHPVAVELALSGGFRVVDSTGENLLPS